MIHMEGMKGGGGRVGVGEDDIGDGMQCIDHPHRNNPGGICAFCLQEKLGKLVSSSFPLPIRASSTSSPSSSSPSFRSDTVASSTTTRPSSSITTATATSAPAAAASSLSLSRRPSSAKKNGSDNQHHYSEYYMRSRLPFLLAKKKKKKPSTNSSSSSSCAAANATSDIIFKRSKSTATPRRGQLLDDADDDIVIEDFSPRKRNRFWSFLHLYSSKPSSSSSKKFDAKSFRDSNGSPRISAVSTSAIAGLSVGKTREKCLVGSSLGRKSDTVLEEGDSPNSQVTASASSFERKVSRSRSVGCGSRSFSGDFFERISTGLGDCTLRRVESQREGKPKIAAGGAAMNRGGDHHCMKERVRCGGIFGGFMITSSSSSSSSSSYWVSSSADDGMNGESAGLGFFHGRARNWGWAFASPMRAFSSKTSSKDNKRDSVGDASDKDATPNLSAIPSLLTVRG